MFQINFHKPIHIHFIGIGGISMSGLAEILLKENFRISGSDTKRSALTTHLESLGCTVQYGQCAENITDDIDARYKAFADAEALLINNALVIPRGMSVPAYLATRLNYWEGQYASTGFSNKRLKGIHVLDHYVSMAEYEANRDAR